MPTGDLKCLICGQWGHSCPGQSSLLDNSRLQYELLYANITFCLNQIYETTDDLKDAIRKNLQNNRKGY